MTEARRKRCQAVLNYLIKHQQEKGFAPSMREIGDAVGIPSTSVVKWYLEILEQEEKIVRAPGIARGIRILENNYDASP
jgi:repressor LexA